MIVREIPTYDRDNLLSDCGGAAGLLLGLNIATLLGFLGKDNRLVNVFLNPNFLLRLYLRVGPQCGFRLMLSTHTLLCFLRLYWTA